MKKFFSLVAVALVAMAANAQEMVYTDLTAEMYHQWTAADATAEMTETAVYPAYDLGVSTGLPYGDGNVYYLNFADLQEYDVLVATATEGEPRFLFNRTVDQGAVGVEFPRDYADGASYETVVDNGDGSKTYTIDLKGILEAQGFVHLHCVKGAYWANTTVTSLQVGQLQETTSISAISSAVANGNCMNILGQRVNKLEAGQIYIINGKKFINR